MRNTLTVLMILLSSILLYGQYQAVPELKGRVTDLTGTLNSQQAGSLEASLKTFEEEKGSQVVVLIIPTTDPEPISSYSIRVAEEWKIGRGGVDDGVILLIAMDDRQLRIEVGYGLEGAIPDAYAKRIIENLILPQFRQGRFYDGISDGVGAIMGLIEGEELPQVTQSSPSTYGITHQNLFVFLIIASLVILSIIKALVKNTGLKWVSVLAISVIVGLVFMNILVGLFGFAISSLVMFSSSSSGRGGGRYYGGGGFFGGSGGSSFGGGGFSGGGGSFGGGGASGGW